MKEWVLLQWHGRERKWGRVYASTHDQFDFPRRKMCLETLEDALKEMALQSRFFSDGPFRIMNVNTYEVIDDAIF